MFIVPVGELDVDGRTVEEDVGDVRLFDEFLQRAQVELRVEDGLDQGFFFDDGEGFTAGVDGLLDVVLDQAGDRLTAELAFFLLSERGEVFAGVLRVVALAVTR